MTRLVPPIALACLMLLVCSCSAGAAPADLDGSFGVDGVATVATVPTEGGADMALGPQDQIYVLSSSYPACEPPFDCPVELTVRRFSAEGKLDPAFGGGPQLVVHQNPFDRDFALAVGPDGKPVVAAFDRAEGLVLERLGLDGQPDPGFGVGGRAPHPGTHGIENAVGDVSIAVQPDGGVLVAAEGLRGEASGTLDVARYLSGGQLDPGFGDGGETQVVTPTQARPHQLLLGPAGSIYIPLPRCCIGGTRQFGEGLTIVRLTASGQPDPAWAGSGELHVATPGARAVVESVALASGGGLFVLFEESTEQIATDDDLLKLLSDGTSDPTFGNGGLLRAYPRVGLASPMGLAVDAKQRIVGVGWEGRMAAFRLLPNGQADRTFGGGRRVELPFGGNDPKPYSVAIESSGRIVLLGESGLGGVGRTFALVGLRGGTDRTHCFGKPATIVGTAGADEIVGTKHRDVIAALGGKDVVRGLGGDDLICGGKGQDVIHGGPGRDRVRQ